MRVAVIGAGVAGLAAARALAKDGHSAVVFEKTKEVGGRIETIAHGGYLFDSGATTIAPRGRVLEDVMFRELEAEGIVQIEAPIYVHNSLRVSPGDPAKNRVHRFAYVAGNVELPKRLAKGLDIRFESEIGSLTPSGHGFTIAGEEFEAVILAIPTPLTQPILETVSETRPFANTLYRPCLSVLLGFPNPGPEVPYHALVDPEGGHPLVWMSIESAKCLGRAPEGKTAIVAQLGPQFSKLHFESEAEVIGDATIDMIVRLYGKSWDAPEVLLVRRWLYSQPEMTALFDSVNRPHSKLIVAGDGVMGGRTEYAFDSGVRAAKLLMENS